MDSTDHLQKPETSNSATREMQQQQQQHDKKCITNFALEETHTRSLEGKFSFFQTNKKKGSRWCGMAWNIGGQDWQNLEQQSGFEANQFH
mmetsp:Transcript_18152/g.50536  ORF Transcript_18152/g.50536 Transcript_18152/m.50536 type:complete len:90 (-) Transcript_18152:5009-5278(-)